MAESLLIVSAEKFIRAICTEALAKAEGYTLDFAKDGEDGLYALSGDIHAAALVEYDMGSMNGLEFLKQIRCGRSRAGRDLSVAMFAGEPDSEVLAAAVGLDLNAILVMPVSKKSIVQRTGRLLTQKIHLKTLEAYEAITVPRSSRQIEARAMAGRAPVTVVLPLPKRPHSGNGAIHHRAGPAALVGRRFGPRMLRLVEEVGYGWQIADDVIGSNGIRLIGAGTVLTAHLLSRLRDMAAEGKIEKVWARAPSPVQ